MTDSGEGDGSRGWEFTTFESGRGWRFTTCSRHDSSTTDRCDGLLALSVSPWGKEIEDVLTFFFYSRHFDVLLRRSLIL